MSVVGQQTLTHCCWRPINREPGVSGGNSQRKLFSLLDQSFAMDPRDPGRVGTRLALLLSEQMLKQL
jgi:hypothetical protein